MPSFLSLLQTPGTFFQLLLSVCSSMLVGLRRPALSLVHGRLSWSSSETTSATELSSALGGCWQPPTVCSCECDHHVPVLCIAPPPPAWGTNIWKATNYVHTFLSSMKPSFLHDFSNGNNVVLLVGDPLKLIGWSAIRAVANPELMQRTCHGEKFLLSSLGNK